MVAQEFDPVDVEGISRTRFIAKLVEDLCDEPVFAATRKFLRQIDDLSAGASAMLTGAVALYERAQDS